MRLTRRKLNKKKGNLECDRYLDLVGENITSIKKDTFNDLNFLESLYLNGNRLSEIDKDLFGCLRLKDLDLSNNQIVSIHKDTFNSLHSLNFLELSKNKITNIHKDTFNSLKLLEYLYLNDNEIKKLHKDTFSFLTNLTVLYLHNNETGKIYAHENIFKNLNTVNTIITGNFNFNLYKNFCLFENLYQSGQNKVRKNLSYYYF
jgi:Leucine-rich repeat (LRR) protein